MAFEREQQMLLPARSISSTSLRVVFRQKKHTLNKIIDHLLVIDVNNYVGAHEKNTLRNFLLLIPNSSINFIAPKLHMSFLQ